MLDWPGNLEKSFTSMTEKNIHKYIESTYKWSKKNSLKAQLKTDQVCIHEILLDSNPKLVY